jgi:hypothetical protein
MHRSVGGDTRGGPGRPVVAASSAVLAGIVVYFASGVFRSYDSGSFGHGSSPHVGENGQMSAQLELQRPRTEYGEFSAVVEGVVPATESTNLSIHITDSSGVGLPDAEVGLALRREGAYSELGASDRAGFYSLEYSILRFSGDYTLVFSTEGFVSLVVACSEARAHAELGHLMEIELPTGASATGVVLMPSGRPAVNADVVAYTYAEALPLPANVRSARGRDP